MIEVEIWSDYACPFCYIGKRNFDLALASFEKRDQVRVTYKSFELDPNAPKSQKVSINEMLAKKYRQTIEWAEQQNERVTQMAAKIGVTFNMDKIVPTNTFDAHRLSHLALKHNAQVAVQEELFKAYFTDGKDLADTSVLLEIAVKVGIDKSEAEDFLKSHVASNDVRVDEDEAQQLGVTGVPFFVFNRESAISGAQPIEVFTQALSQLT